MTQKTTEIGFLGVGTMGLAMATNLLKAGYKLTVWNRSSEKCDPLKELGAKVAQSPQEVAKACEIIFVMLANPQVATDVAAQAAKGLTSGKGYIDVSTIDADTAQSIRDTVTSSGATYLEAPVSGSKQPAEQGQLYFLCGGNRELFEKAGPLFDVMGKEKKYLGEVGNGANMKLIINMMMGTILTSLAEGLTLAEKCGLNKSDLVEVANAGSIAAPIIKLKGPTMSENEFPLAFGLKHELKDLKLATDLAKSLALDAPLAEATAAKFKEAEAAGYGEEDFSAVLKAYQK